MRASVGARIESSSYQCPPRRQQRVIPVNGDGTVTLWAVTSTVSASVDQGADANRLVTITDTLAFTTPA